jgi:hypothetical protein
VLYDTDWQREIYQMAPTYDGNVSVTGKIGTFLPYRVSGGYTEQVGTLKGSKMDRATASLNLSPSFLDNHLTVNLNGKGTYAFNQYANQDAIGAANHYDPTKPVYNKVGGYNLNGYTTWFDGSGNINTMATMNPVGRARRQGRYGQRLPFPSAMRSSTTRSRFRGAPLQPEPRSRLGEECGHDRTGQGFRGSYHNTNQSGGGQPHRLMTTPVATQPWSSTATTTRPSTSTTST